MKKHLLVVVLVSFNLYGFSLQEGLQLTLDNDPEVRVRNNDVQTILHDIDAAKGLNYPKLDFSSDVQREKLHGSEISANDYNRKAYDWAFILTQPIYDGGDAKYEEKLQKSRYESAKSYLLESANSVALKYIEAYLNVLREKALLKLTDESYMINKEIFEKKYMKYEKGIATRLEFERSKAKLDEAVANNAIQQMNYNESIITLRQYLQEDVDAKELEMPSFPFVLPLNYEKAMQEALLKHPSLKVTSENIQVAMNEYQRDRKRFKPTVNLVARYGSWDEIPALAQTKDDYSIGLQFRYNLYNGGRDIALDQKSQKNIDEKRILDDKALQQIDNRLRLAWNAYTLNSKKIDQIRTYTKAKETVLKTTFQAYDLGTIDLNVLLTTEDEYITSKKTLISANHDLLLSKYRIHEGIGDVVELIMTHKDIPATDNNDWDDSVLFQTPLSMSQKHAIVADISSLQQEPTVSRELATQCYEITGSKVNVRKAPTSKSDVIKTYHQGESVCGKRQIGTTWIGLDEGWISSAYVKAIDTPKITMN